jgi:SHS2 domain-containing protein
MEPAAGTYAFFDHVADVGLEVAAPSLEGLFRTAAQALMDWTGPAPGGARNDLLDVALEAPDLEELLVRWLQELVVSFQTEHLYAVGVAELAIGEGRLRARVQCRRWEEADFEAYREVKAVTYHGLKVEQEGDGWRARVILDL